MQAKMIINGVDFAPWIRADGIVQSDVYRRSRSVVDMSGTLHWSDVAKRRITVTLVEMRDATLAGLMAALKSPATVEYTDRSRGDIVRVCKVSSVSATTRRVQGGNTYYRGVTFALEEK